MHWSASKQYNIDTGFRVEAIITQNATLVPGTRGLGTVSLPGM